MIIAVNAIAQDEERHVAEWLAACDGADLICVSDCGSVDQTPAVLAADPRVRLSRLALQPFRFDDAHNAALALVPADVDWVVIADLDERLQPGWRAEIETAARANPKVQGLIAQVQHTAGTLITSIRAHRRYAVRWKYPAHVLPMLTGSSARSKLTLVHCQDGGKDRRGRLALMQLGVRDYPHDPRPWYYLGRELYYYWRWRESGDALARYLSLGGFPAERSSAMRMLSECCGRLGDRQNRLAWALKACAEAPHYREPWCTLAQAHLERKELAAAAGAAAQALSITVRPTDWITDGAAWGALPERLLAEAQAGPLSPDRAGLLEGRRAARSGVLV
jgi:glycosyltransferase involved in cell wall biosynthesis